MPTDICEIGLLSLGNSYKGRLNFRSRFVVPIPVDSAVLAGSIARIERGGGSFLGVREISTRDEEGYLGRLTGAFRARLGELLVASRGRIVTLRVDDRHLQQVKVLVFNPEVTPEPHLVRLSGIEFFPFSHGVGYLVVTVESPVTVVRSARYEKPRRWPFRTAIDVNYYLSRLSACHRPGRNYPLVAACGPDDVRRTYMHRLVAVCAEEIVRGGGDWMGIWRDEQNCSPLIERNRAIVYSHACVIPGQQDATQGWLCSGDSRIRGAEALLFALSQFREGGLRKPARHERWTEGTDEACRIHGYTPMHVMGVLLNGHSVFDATRYPHIYHGSNFFSFLLAYSMRHFYEQLQNDSHPPAAWAKLACVFRPSEVTEEPVRARFLGHCMHFFGLQPSFADTLGARLFLVQGETVQHEFNYRMVFDLGRKSVVIERRSPTKGDKYTAAFQACDSADYLLLASLAIRAALGTNEKYLAFSDVLNIYEGRSLGDKARPFSRRLVSARRKKAHSCVNSLRRRLKAKGIIPDDVFVACKSDASAVGLVLQPTVKIEGLSTVSTRHAISSDEYREDEGENSALDREVSSRWKNHHE